MSTQTIAPSAAAEEQVFVAGSPQIASELRGLLPSTSIADAGESFDPILPAVVLGDSAEVFRIVGRQRITEDRARIIYILGEGDDLPPGSTGFPIFAFLTRPLHARVAEKTIHAALDALRLAGSHNQLQKSLRKAYIEIDELNKIGTALSSERNVDKLLTLILQKSREITFSDAGAVFLVEENEQGTEKVLRFTLTQNDSVQTPFREFTIPIDKTRISGYVALTGEPLHVEDAYRLSAGGALPFSFNKDIDIKSGYRTKSMLTVPMKNHKGEIVGVLQLLNHKKDWNARVTPQNADEVVFPYPERSQHLVSSLASQAAVALENTRLIQDIQNLFEGFVNASVTAIEARDPTTSGHSFRVKDLTVALAEAVDRADDGPYANVKFSREQIREIRYASVLHDFGKVGVREHVLVKANKLYPQQLEVVQERFNYVRKAIQEENNRRRIDYILQHSREEYLARQPQFDSELAERLKEIDDYLAFALECNRPTVLPEGNFERLTSLAAQRYLSWSGEEKPLLTGEEARLLSIPKGSLDESERREIESHVVHTFSFLAQIPWTKELRGIPEIARAHHEKLDGTGYPFRLTAAEIPVQSRMMTISDIYDALSASDRPYKKALPPEKSLNIIQEEVKRKLLDDDLFRIFLAKDVWKTTLPKS